ncbi:MAG: hypothetical protein NVS2B3_04890 [Vulcanimicrobiaceae bacterium]
MKSSDEFGDAGGIDLERRRAPSPWVLLGVALFVITFLLGWRSAAKKTPKRTDDSDLPGAGGQQPS